MLINHLLPLILLPTSHAAETILGLYIFSRHGDRTAKSTPPANLTNLGYREVFDSGSWFRSQYVASGAPKKLAGLNTDIVKLSQLTVSAPMDSVLMSSAQGFLQGLYPPVGSTLGSSTLRNGTVVQAPLDGYQIIPVTTVASGTNSEDSSWLQGNGNCENAIVSSNDYYNSPEYRDLLNSTMPFYQTLSPVINATFSANEMSFKNAYTIYDLINVAQIHNTTIPSSTLLPNSTLTQLLTLSSTHEYSLAYNATSPVRAIAGATLAAQILQSLNNTITTHGKTPLTIQFGPYGSFQSFFGLANLTILTPDFSGLPDYASSMTFELFTTASSSSASPFPPPSDLQIRFLFHNGTTGNNSIPTPWPLFGTSNTTISWPDFAARMGKFAIGTQEQWCQACGNRTGVCAAASASTTSSSSSSRGGEGGNGLSPVVNGVIGAMVTLAVVLGVEGLVLLLVGLRFVRRKGEGDGKGEGRGKRVGVVGQKG